MRRGTRRARRNGAGILEFLVRLVTLVRAQYVTLERFDGTRCAVYVTTSDLLQNYTAHELS